jgi:transposase
MIEASNTQLCRVWNALVGATKHAEHECKHGRKTCVVKRLTDLLTQKKVVGMRAAAVKKLAESKAISLTDANNLLTREQVARESRTIVRKNGTKARRCSIRKLALAYAIATVGHQINRFGVESAAFWGVIEKFKTSTADYPLGKRGAPRFKRVGDNVSMQAQTKNQHVKEGVVDLSRLVGSSCSCVHMIQHRPIPDGAIVKQMAVVKQNDRLFVAIFVDVPDAAAQKSLMAASGATAGIDPGRKTAVSLSSTDGTIQQVVSPPLLRDKRFMRRTARLARKLDRQRRFANPDRYNEDGTFKRGARGVWVTTKGMTKTQKRANDLRRRLVDVRTEHYRLKAREVLNQFDHVGIGTWRPKGAPGEGQAKRAQLRKDADNALGQFAGILRDYAARNVTPKKIYDINEVNTTRRCINCGEMTGPSGLSNLGVREWTCSHCGAHHQRDFASARAIALRTQIVADTHLVNDGPTTKIQPVRYAAKRNKRSGLVATPINVPVEQEAEAARSRLSKNGARASAPVVDHPADCTRVRKANADEGSSNILASEPATNACKGNHRSHSCAVELESTVVVEEHSL